jgi:hypothetical protein
MLKFFELPDLGEGTTMAKIVKWHVDPGDWVALNQVIIEVETVSAFIDLPSPFTGVVDSLLVAEGQTAEVGTPIIALRVGEILPESVEPHAGLSVLPRETAQADVTGPVFASERPIARMYSVAHADNDRILVWWLPDYDDELHKLVDEYQWAWPSMARVKLEAVIPAKDLTAWRESDPICARRPWSDVLTEFAAARAEQLGIVPRQPRQVACSCCSAEFLEHTAHTIVQRLGVNNLDVCYECLEKALYTRGSSRSSRDVITAVLQALATALQRPPRKGDISGRINLKVLTRDQRRLAIQALMVKPTTARVDAAFGTWQAAVEHATDFPEIPLPGYSERVQTLSAGTEFTSTDPARYKEVIGPLPRVSVGPQRYQGDYVYEITSLLETGYLALAEAVLLRLARPGNPLTPVQELAYLYGQTARLDEARAVIKATWKGSEPFEYKLRDFRTITTGPAFYEPLPSGPRGNARFILVGGPMEYVDRRGEHSCVTGDDEGPDPASDRGESAMRVHAMAHSDAWLQAAAELGKTLLVTSTRGETNPRAYGLLVAHAYSQSQRAIRNATGMSPKKLSDDTWTIGSAGRLRWYQQRDPRQYVFNARADYDLIRMDPSPSVSIWAWPDRSDLVLQAFSDTVAASDREVVTVILPDVPAFRSFARRYGRRQDMTNIERTWMEETLFPRLGMTGLRHARVLSGEFAPRLVINADGSEDDGSALASALAYLDANHAARLSVWDVLADPLMRDIATLTPVAGRPFKVAASHRRDLIRTYSLTSGLEGRDDIGTLLRPYRPTLLDAIQL